MSRLHEHIARRTALASVVMTVTLALCAGIAVSTRRTDGTDGTIVAVLTVVGACYFASLAAVAHARRTSKRVRDSLPGMLVPAMGYAAAIPAAIAVPIAVLDTTVASVGPASPLLAILSGIGAVLGLMLLARTLELRIDPPAAATFDPPVAGPSVIDVEPRELRDMP